MEDFHYLEENFDPATLTVVQLRSVLVEHRVKYPSNALKPALVAKFNEEITPNRLSILETYNSAAQPLVPSKRASDDDDSDFVNSSMASVTSNSELKPRKRKQKKSTAAAPPKVSTPPPGSYLNLERLEMDENDDILNLEINQVQTPLKSTSKTPSVKPVTFTSNYASSPLNGPKKPLETQELSEIVTLDSSDDEEIERVIERVDEIEKEVEANGSLYSFDEIDHIDVSLDEETDVELIGKHVEEHSSIVEEESVPGIVDEVHEHVSESEPSPAVKVETKPVDTTTTTTTTIELDIPVQTPVKESSHFSKLVKYLTITMLLSSIGVSTVAGFTKFAEMKNQSGYCSASSLSPLNDPTLHKFQQPVKLTDSLLPDSFHGYNLKPQTEFLSNMESKFWDFSSEYLKCEPCPVNGECSPNGDVKCNVGFMKSHNLAHYLSFGSIPNTLTTSCEVDTITPLKLEFIREYSHNLLRRKEDGTMSLGELHDLLKASSGDNMNDDQFEEYWSLYLKTELGINNPAHASTEKLEVSISMLNTLDTINHVTPTQFKDHKLPTGGERRKKRSIFKPSSHI